MLENFLKDSIVVDENKSIIKQDTINRLLYNIELAYNKLQEENPDKPGKRWRNNNDIIPFARGNNKLPQSTYIVNLGCSSLCPGRALGTCSNCNICYAMKAENQYKESTLLYRLLQTLRWRDLKAKTIADGLLKTSENAKVHKMKYLRLNEAGDVFEQKDIKKMSKIADLLAKEDIGTYTYTSRYDLDWSKSSKNLIVNGSGFMVDNQFQTCKKHDNTMMYKCHGDCDVCDNCKSAKGIIIYVEEH